MEYSSSSIAAALGLIDELDKLAVPEDIWLTDEEFQMLKKSSGLAILCKVGKQLIAAGFYVPATELLGTFEGIDPLFDYREDEAYIYSVAVHPDYRRRGVGTNMRRQLCQCAATAGFKTGSTHVRKMDNWDNVGLIFYQPFMERTVKDYWEGSAYPDVKFMRFDLNKIK